MFPRVSATTAADAGAKALDVIRPGWFREIDIPNLAMHYGENCIVGQLFGPFGDTAAEVANLIDPGHSYHTQDLDGWDAVTTVMTNHGFIASLSNSYWQLEDRWKAEINDRIYRLSAVN